MPRKTDLVKIDFTCLMKLSESTDDIPNRVGTFDIGDAIVDALVAHVAKVAAKHPDAKVHVVEVSDASVSVNLYCPKGYTPPAVKPAKKPAKPTRR